MFPIVAAMLGGAAVAAGSYSYRKIKTVQKLLDVNRNGDFSILLGGLQNAASSAYSGIQTEITKSGRKLTVVVSKSAETVENVRQEAQILAMGVFEEAHAAFDYVNEVELKPLSEAVRDEWHVLKEVISEDDGIFAEGARAARDAFSAAATETLATGKKVIAHSPIAEWASTPSRKSTNGKKSVSMGPRAVWRSLKQARELVFDDLRGRQMEEMSGTEDDTVFRQLAVAEQTVNRYMKIAASSAAVATAGMLLLPPLKLVSGAMILVAAFPIFKNTYTDLVVHRKITIKILDSVSFIGLLAGGYFLICSITTTIFHASTKLMLKTEDRSRQILANMFGQQPRSVRILVDGEEVEIAFEALKVGDTLVVHAGQMIPIDGLIASGTAAIDQHILTGEAQPSEKGPGDKVFAATMLLAGRIEVRVEKTGAETAAAQIRQVLATTTDFRTAIQARWRDVADHTVVPTLGLSAAALALLNPLSALAVVNSNYVAVMKVASPLGMLNFLQRASQAGVLIKDGRALEATSRVDTVVFDKTGTLTETQPHVGELYPVGDISPNELLTYAAAVEANQSHPIAQAILQAAMQRGLKLPSLDEARYEVGYGIEARIAGRLVRVGSARYMALYEVKLPAEFQSRREASQAQGASVVYVAFEDRLAGAIELRPTLRAEAKEVVAKLKGIGLKLYIISGDQTAPTQALASELGIDNFFAEVLPQDKSGMVEKLQKEGRRVCFVGDGINDAIALKKADVSVSLRGASSLATDTAQIILMDETLRQLPQLFDVASDYDRNLKTLMATTFVPGLASLAGVFLLGTGNAAALLLFNLSMVAGLVNSIWPALQNIEEPVEVKHPSPRAAAASNTN